MGRRILDPLDASPARERLGKRRHRADDRRAFADRGGWSATKLRSILITSNGSERRCDSDEKPVPKSSSARRMPWFLRLVTIDRASSRSANSELSVISTTSRSAGKPVSVSSRTIRCASQLSVSCVGEMLTDSLIAGSQSAAFGQRARMTCSDSRPIRPISSATGMNRSGSISPAQRVVPARQHFEADDLAGLQVDLRLEIRNELAVLEAVADALLDLAVGDQRPLHARVEPDRAGRRGRSWHGRSRCRRGAAGPGRDLGRRRRGDAGKRADLDHPPPIVERPGDRAQQRFADRLGLAKPSSGRRKAIANSSPLRRAIPPPRQLLGQMTPAMARSSWSPTS